jgi:hypothetical protein
MDINKINILHADIMSPGSLFEQGINFMTYSISFILFTTKSCFGREDGSKPTNTENGECFVEEHHGRQLSQMN